MAMAGGPGNGNRENMQELTKDEVEKRSNHNDKENGNESVHDKSSVVENQARFDKKSVTKLSIANCFTAIANIALGVVVFMENAILPYWVAKTAFAIWFGLLILLTSVSGAFAVTKPSSFARSFLHGSLNILTFILSIMSMSLNGQATMHYKRTIDRGIYPNCGANRGAKAQQNFTFNLTSNGSNTCFKTFENTATLLCAIFAILLVVSIVEFCVSFLLLIFLRKPMKCCCRWLMTSGSQDHMMRDQYSMYATGYQCGAAFGDMSIMEYRIDSRPLTAPICNKLTAQPVKNTSKYMYQKCQERQQGKKRLAFCAMEPINETQETCVDEEDEEDEILISKEQEKRDEVLEFLSPEP
eukprot:gene12102-13353_t